MLDIINNCANEVWRLMGVGDYEEKHYQKLLNIFLNEHEIPTQLEYNIPINVVSPYSKRTHQIQNCRVDIYVDSDNPIIIELKREAKLTELHEEQVKKYLLNTNCKTGILINFPKKTTHSVEFQVINKEQTEETEQIEQIEQTNI